MLSAAALWEVVLLNALLLVIVSSAAALWAVVLWEALLLAVVSSAALLLVVVSSAAALLAAMSSVAALWVIVSLEALLLVFVLSAAALLAIVLSAAALWAFVSSEALLLAGGFGVLLCGFFQARVFDCGLWSLVGCICVTVSLGLVALESVWSFAARALSQKSKKSLPLRLTALES